MKKFFTSIWGVWLTLTAIYVSLTFILGIPETGNTPFIILGLFVPFGVFNTFSALGNLTSGGIGMLIGSLAILVGIGGIALGNHLIKRFQLNIFWSIIFSLIFLFFITFFVDIILYHQWCSMAFFESENCGTSF